MTTLRKEPMAILFADAHGYSKLTAEELNAYLTHVLPRIAAILKKHKRFQANSWGDGIVSFFKSASDAARCALEIRDLFNNESWSSLHLPSDLRVRIALHFGTIFVGSDPIQERRGFVGSNINLAARIEPVATDFSVYATDTFVQILKGESDQKVKYDYYGVKELAKNWGPQKLYRLRWESNPQAEYRAILTPPKDSPIEPVEWLIFREQLRNPVFGLSWAAVEQRCKRDLLIIGWSCRGIHLGKSRDTFLNLAKAGREVSFLIFDPSILRSSSINLGPVCNVEPDYVHSDVVKAIDDIAQLFTMAGKWKKNLTLRLTSWLIAWSAVAIDRASPDGLLQIENYHYMNPYGLPEHLDKRPELVLATESVFYEGFRRSVDAIWASAKPHNPLK
jgi:class 3 adenylate cyclase